MAEAKGIDVLMRIVTTAGGPAMSSESLTSFSPLAPADTLVKDFSAGQFCELQEFNFSAGVGQPQKKKAAGTADAGTSSESTGGGQSELDQKLQLYRSRLDRLDRRETAEFVDMQPVGFTRIMDSASTLLFKALTECTTLASVSIVKRKAAGAANAGLGYLRMDFENVLITSIDWKDSEHVMMESGEFIYRKLTLQYRPQKPNGSLDVAVSTSWQMQVTRTGT